jgi:hypothetical protein
LFSVEQRPAVGMECIGIDKKVIKL